MGLRLPLERMGFRFNGMDGGVGERRWQHRSARAASAAFLRPATSTSAAVTSTSAGVVFHSSRPSIGTRNLPSFFGNCSNKCFFFFVFNLFFFHYGAMCVVCVCVGCIVKTPLRHRKIKKKSDLSSLHSGTSALFSGAPLSR